MTEAPIVAVEQGRLRGKTVTSPAGKTFYSFQGIPYAKPPLGVLRFRAPQPPESWKNIREATSEGNISAQVNYLFDGSHIGDEDCLYLNVYTPRIQQTLLPVMIWIHGGGFMWGSGSNTFYGGDYLVEKDVVVVTMNYRCGHLGFLCLNTPEVPGNAGIKDIVQAIRWIKKNIQNFGGDPNNLTIFGESAGGIAVSLLCASPLSENLINRAIIQSGTALMNFAFQKDPVKNAINLAKGLGCVGESVHDLLQFLTATPAKDLVDYLMKMNTSERFSDELSDLGLVVEQEFPDVEAVITEKFINFLTSGRMADVPVMIGTTAVEMGMIPECDDLQSLIPKELNIRKDSTESLAIATKIKSLYFKGNPTDAENLLDYFHLVSDLHFNINTRRYIKYLIQQSRKPIYYYKFDYVGELNMSNYYQMFSLGYKNPAHMDELGYLFKNDFQQNTKPTAQDLEMREKMVRLWTNFAKYGNPTPEENHYLPVNWLPVTNDELYCLRISSELSLVSNPDKEKMDFWGELYEKYFRIWDHPKTNATETPRKTETVEESVVVTTQTLEATDEVGIVNVYSGGEPVQMFTEIAERFEAQPEPLSLEFKHVKEEATVINQVIGHVNGVDKKPRTSNEIKMAHSSIGAPKNVIRASDSPEDDLPKNIGVNKFVNFFESLGGKK